MEIVQSALRSTVNDELNELHFAVKLATDFVSQGGNSIFFLSGKTHESMFFSALDSKVLILEEKCISKFGGDSVFHFIRD